MKPVFREIGKKYIEVIGHYDNPILCAKLTLLADLYAVKSKEGYALFKVEDYDKLSKIDDSLKFGPIVPLGGCVYVDGESVPVSAVNFTWSDNLGGDFTEGENNQVLYNGKVIYYYGVAVLTTDSVYDGERYFTIADLTGTTWEINNSINISQSTEYFINFTSKTESYTGIVFEENHSEMYYFNDYLVSIAAYSDGLWENEAYQTIEITGGTDATSPDFIAWLQANATQVVEPEPDPEPEPTGSSNFFIGGAGISKMLIGNSEISKIFLGNFEIYSAGSEPEPEPSIEWVIIDDTQTFEDQQDTDSNNYKITSTGQLETVSYAFDGVVENNGLLVAYSNSIFNNAIYLKGNSQANLTDVQILNENHNIYVEDNAQLTISGTNTLIYSLDNIVHTSTNNIIINGGTSLQDPRNYNFITIPSGKEVQTVTYQGQTFYRVVVSSGDNDIN